MSTRPRVPGPSAPAAGKLVLPELGEMKRRGDRITMLTAYDAPAALLADQAGVELVLVGDSAAMVMLGHESTVSVTLDEMIFLTRAVTRSARRPLVIGDLPFGSYEVSDEQAVASAIRMLKEGGADCVKLEGAGRMVSRVRAIAESNIGVMAHIGLTPQSATKLGGFRAQGRTADAALKLYDDALALQDAGCFALVLEAVPAAVAARITAALDIPTIGIGAGPECDGQVLVWHDLLGLYAGQAPRFVKRYAGLSDEIATALEAYVGDVREGSFPEEQHPTRSPTLSSSSSWPPRRARLEEQEQAAEHHRGCCGDSGPRPRPAMDGANAEHEQADRPGQEPEPGHGEHLPGRAAVIPTGVKERVPKSASLNGHRTSDSATGTAAKASTWRLRR